MRPGRGGDQDREGFRGDVRGEGEGRVGRGWVWAVRVTHLDTVLKAVELPAGVTDLFSRGPASVHPSFALHFSGIQKQSTGHLGWAEGRAGRARGGSGRACGAGRARGGERVRGARTHLDTGLPDVDGDDLTHCDWGVGGSEAEEATESFEGRGTRTRRF